MDQTNGSVDETTDETNGAVDEKSRAVDHTKAVVGGKRGEGRDELGRGLDGRAGAA